jgi:hypothetical protein
VYQKQKFRLSDYHTYQKFQIMDLSEYKTDIAYQITENWENWKIQSDILKEAFSELTDGDIIFEFHTQHNAGENGDTHCHGYDSSKQE